MNARQSSPVSAAPGGWSGFWLTPMSPTALHVLRVIAGLAFLAWLLPLAGHVDALFGPAGWFDLRAYRQMSSLPDGPPKPVGWSLVYLAGSSSSALAALYWGSIAVLVLFTLGIWPRLTAILTWLVVLSFTANPALDLEAHILFVPLASYLALGYLLLGQHSQGLSFLTRLLGSVRPFRSEPALARPSLGANLAVRLLQVHLALIIVISGLHKLQFGDWWSGVALWYRLNPPLEATAQSIRLHAPTLAATMTRLSLAAYLILTWQIAFPLFAWRRWGWVLVLLGAVIGSVGIVILLSDPLWAIALLTCSLAFVPVEVWSWAGNRLWQRTAGDGEKQEEVLAGVRGPRARAQDTVGAR